MKGIQTICGAMSKAEAACAVNVIHDTPRARKDGDTGGMPSTITVSTYRLLSEGDPSLKKTLSRAARIPRSCDRWPHISPAELLRTPLLCETLYLPWLGSVT